MSILQTDKNCVRFCEVVTPNNPIRPFGPDIKVPGRPTTASPLFNVTNILLLGYSVIICWSIFIICSVQPQQAEFASPAGPVAPVGPVTPLAPVGPVAPVAPVGPVGPVTPLAPVGPVTPVTPVGPVGPVEPCIYAQH